MIGGIDEDQIDAGNGDNLVFGDFGVIDWTAAERGGTLPGDDLDAADIDRVWSTSTTLGAVDSITSGSGNDIVFAGIGADTVNAGDGRNIVFGDNGEISSATRDE